MGLKSFLKGFLKDFSNLLLSLFSVLCEICSSQASKVTFWAKRHPQNHPFSSGFIRFSDMVKRHVRFIYKPNAFLIILGAFLRFGLQNHQFPTGSIRFCDMAKHHVRFIYKPNAFLLFRMQFSDIDSNIIKVPRIL